MLIDLIREYALADAQAGQWSAVAAILNAANIAHRDTTPLTYSRIRVALGEEIRQKVAGTMRTIGASAHPLAGEIRDAHSVMLIEAGGIDISTDDRQALIDLVATTGGWSAEESAAVKSLGVRMVSLAGETVTASQCQAAIEADDAIPDSVGHQVLLSLNRQHDGTRQLVCRVTAVNLLAGQVLSQGESRAIIAGQQLSEAEQALMDAVDAAVSAYVGGL